MTEQRNSADAQPWEVTAGPEKWEWAVCGAGAGDIIAEVGPQVVDANLNRERAYLFAAAPDLLAALEAAEGELDHLDHATNGAASDSIIMQARTAIRKARNQ